MEQKADKGIAQMEKEQRSLASLLFGRKRLRSGEASIGVQRERKGGWR